MTQADALLYWGGVREHGAEARPRMRKGALDAPILASLPATANEIADETGINLRSVQSALTRMERAGRVQWVGYDPATPRRKIWDVAI